MSGIKIRRLILNTEKKKNNIYTIFTSHFSRYVLSWLSFFLSSRLVQNCCLLVINTHKSFNTYKKLVSSIKFNHMAVSFL